MAQLDFSIFRNPRLFFDNHEEFFRALPPYKIKERIAIIPCAGRATRMGEIGLPKALWPINGVPAVERLLNALSPYFQQFYISVNDTKSDKELFRAKLGNELMEHTVLVETVPGLGEGDAVLRTMEIVPGDYDGEVLITWGDTVIMDEDLVPQCLRLLDQVGNKTPMLLPTVIENEPYVAIIRDDYGIVCDVKFRRRGEICYNKEHDMNLFFGNYLGIKRHLTDIAHELRKTDGTYESFNAELSFLDIVKSMSSKGKEVVAVCMGHDDSVGSFNTVEEAQSIEKVLLNKSKVSAQ